MGSAFKAFALVQPRLDTVAEIHNLALTTSSYRVHETAFPKKNKHAVTRRAKMAQYQSYRVTLK
jgi:hypothetical protein